MPKRSCIILIDGSNFFFKLRDLGISNLLEFNFFDFANSLCDGYSIKEKIYYIGAVKTDGTEHTKKLHDNQQKLLANLRRHGFRYKLG